MTDYYDQAVSALKTVGSLSADVVACGVGGMVGAFGMYYCHSSYRTTGHMRQNTRFSQFFQKAEEKFTGSGPWHINEYLPTCEKYKIISTFIAGCTTSIAIERTALGMIVTKDTDHIPE